MTLKKIPAYALPHDLRSLLRQEGSLTQAIKRGTKQSLKIHVVKNGWDRAEFGAELLGSWGRPFWMRAVRLQFGPDLSVTAYSVFPNPVLRGAAGALLKTASLRRPIGQLLWGRLQACRHTLDYAVVRPEAGEPTYVRSCIWKLPAGGRFLIQERFDEFFLAAWRKHR